MTYGVLNSRAILIKRKLRALALGFCLINWFSVYSQSITNLVLNPSFETFTSCPATFGQLKKCLFWFDPAIYSSPDYFNSCNTNTATVSIPLNSYGSQLPRNGAGYAGIGAYIKENYNKEFIGCKINTTLKPNKTYCVTYYVNLAEMSRYAILNLGFHFTQDSIKHSLPPQPPYQFNLTPSFEVTSGSLFGDTLNWMQVRGLYSANGTENFLTIGNFRDTINTVKQQIKPLLTLPYLNYAYYYIDDVSLIEINPAKAYALKSITVCANTTFTLGSDSTEEATYSWQPITGLSCTNCPNPTVTVNASIKYYLTKQQCSATTKDSVFIHVYTPTLSAKAGEFKSICIGDSVKLGVNDTTAFTGYSWQPVNGLSCNNCPQPTAFPNSPTTFTLSKKECSFNTKDTVSVFVDPCEVIIPDIFSPNNDNVNDEWKIKFPLGFSVKMVAVYNRWGTLIYSIEDEVLNKENSKIRTIHWDGRTNSGLECSEGVYFYVLQYSDKSGLIQKKNGHITLVR